MDPEIATLARVAAGRLTAQLGDDLSTNVEAVLHGGSTPQRFGVDTWIALASLLVSIAQLAWDVHKDARASAKPLPTPEVIARRIRLGVSLPAGVTSGQRDQIIEVVVDELPRS